MKLKSSNETHTHGKDACMRQVKFVKKYRVIVATAHVRISVKEEVIE